jgi:plasmid stabilization system protein ParE
VKILFSSEVLEVFEELPDRSKRKAAELMPLIAKFPRMFKVRKKGLLRGYRCFEVEGKLFYYEVSSTETRIIAILPGRMRGA